MIKKLVHTPDGVRDIYGDEEQRKLYIEKQIQNVIYSYGYQDIQTPTFEYLDVFSKEVDSTPSKELYKFFDKDGNTLCLRPDFTPSVARSVAKYFSDETNPIKLTYLGNTFTNSNSLQGKLKEVTQVGVEYMNDDSAVADAETINLVIEALKSTGLQDFQVSIGHMDYFKGLCESAGIDEEKEDELREYISSKNYIRATELVDSIVKDDKQKELLMMTNETIGDISVIKEAKNKVNNNRSKNALLRLEDISEILKIYGNEKYISFDLGILSNHNYYTGVLFNVYTYGIGDVLVKGGRYDNLVESFGNSKPAIGFMIVIDDLLMALRSQDIALPCKDSVITVSYTAKNLEEKIKEVIKLRNEGHAVSLVQEGR